MKSSSARSISTKLSTISQERKIPYENILTDFLIERLVVRLLANKELANSLIFKGGYVSLRAYGSPRYTIDLDALLKGRSISTTNSLIIKGVETDLEDGTWFKYEKTIDLETQGEYGGTRFVFRSGLGEILPDLKRAKIINFDVGIGDAVTPSQTKLQSLLNETAISWMVYPCEVIVSEKLHAILSRPLGNSRSKDIFDLAFFLPKCDSATFKRAIVETYLARGDEMPKNIYEAFSGIRTETLKRGWVSAVSSVVGVESFDIMFEKVQKYLKMI